MSSLFGVSIRYLIVIYSNAILQHQVNFETVPFTNFVFVEYSFGSVWPDKSKQELFGDYFDESK